MKKLEFLASREQWKTLEALAYWIAETAYTRERFGETPELYLYDETIRAIFGDCDKLGIPFWVQNAAIAYGSDWRQHEEKYMETVLNPKNIFCA